MTTTYKRNYLNPINVIIGLIIVVILFEGFSITTGNLHTSQNQELINIAIDQNEDQKKIIEAQGNLSAAARAKILNAIIDNEQVLIPNINRTLTNINQTLDVIRNAAPQSNFTAQKLATERIENITRDVAEIKATLSNQ
jgi:hypothetical protein